MPPWEILEDAYDDTNQLRRVRITCTDTSALMCPMCTKRCPFYDLRTPRIWCHLDTCKYRTELTVQVPRVHCPEHGVRTILVPWALPSSRFTRDFEDDVLGWLQEASILAVSRQLGVGWKAISRIMGRAVERGLEHRESQMVAHI